MIDDKFINFFVLHVVLAKDLKKIHLTKRLTCQRLKGEWFSYTLKIARNFEKVPD